MNTVRLSILSAIILLSPLLSIANERMSYSEVLIDFSRMDLDYTTISTQGVKLSWELSEHFYGGISVADGKESSGYDIHFRGTELFIGAAIDLTDSFDFYAELSSSRVTSDRRFYYDSGRQTSFALGAKKGFGDFVGTLEYERSGGGYDNESSLELNVRYYIADDFFFGITFANVDGDFAKGISFGKTF